LSSLGPPSPASPGGSDIPSRRFPRTVLLLTLLAGGVLLAWAAHRRVFRPHENEPSPKSRPRRSSLPDTKPWPVSAPAEAFGETLAERAVRPLEGDPGGIAPPPSARRVSAFEFSDGTLYGRYDDPGPMESAEDHYRRTLEAKGYRRLGEVSVAEGGRTVVYERDGAQALVTLRKKASDGKMVVEIVVLVKGFPAGEAGPK